MKEEKDKERHTAGAHGGKRRTHKSGGCKTTLFTLSFSWQGSCCTKMVPGYSDMRQKKMVPELALSCKLKMYNLLSEGTSKML